MKPSQNGQQLNLYLKSEKFVCVNIDQFYNWQHIVSPRRAVYRTVTVSLNSINIFAQEQFGYGKGMSDVKILYNFIGEILSALTNKTHSSGLSAELVRPF